jgi:membrane protein DedA with SNARE-associated domain
MPSLSAISELAQAHQVLAYGLLFVFALFGGPTVALFAGFLARLGYLDIFAAYCILIAGDYFPDTAYYYIGKYAHSKGWVEKLARHFTSKSTSGSPGSSPILENKSMLENLWKNHTGKMMLFSKQAYGLSSVLLISSGLANVSYRRFISYALSITIVQYIVFAGLGYVLGYSYAAAGPYISYLRWAAAAVAIIFIAGFILIQKRTRKTFLAMENPENKS